MSLFDLGGTSATVPPLPPPEPDVKVYTANNPNDKTLVGNDPGLQLFALTTQTLATGFIQQQMCVAVKVTAATPQKLRFYFSIDQDPPGSPPPAPGPGSGAGSYLEVDVPASAGLVYNYSWTTIAAAAQDIFTVRLWMDSPTADPLATFTMDMFSPNGQGANMVVLDPAIPSGF